MDDTVTARDALLLQAARFRQLCENRQLNMANAARRWRAAVTTLARQLVSQYGHSVSGPHGVIVDEVAAIVVCDEYHQVLRDERPQLLLTEGPHAEQDAVTVIETGSNADVQIVIPDHIRVLIPDHIWVLIPDIRELVKQPTQVYRRTCRNIAWMYSHRAGLYEPR